MSIDQAFGLIRQSTATHAASPDGAGFEGVLDHSKTASDVWAGTPYRFAKNEEMLSRRSFVSRIHRKKPKRKSMPESTRIANARKSRVRGAVEPVSSRQKCLMGVVVRTIGLASARLKIGLANLTYNMRRLGWLQAKCATA